MHKFKKKITSNGRRPQNIKTRTSAKETKFKYSENLHKYNLRWKILKVELLNYKQAELQSLFFDLGQKVGTDRQTGSSIELLCN